MYADEIGAHMGLARRITKLEAKAGNVRTGKLPVSVVNKVLNRTISEWEFKRWLPVIEQILGRTGAYTASISRADRCLPPSSRTIPSNGAQDVYGL